MSKSILSLAVFGAVAVSAAWGQIPPGYEIVQITDDPDHDSYARINNCGEIVFSKRIDQIHDREEIFLWDNGRVQQVTDDDIRDAFADINDAGTIVWTHDPEDYDENQIVMRLAGGEATVLGIGRAPSINNLGHLAFLRYTATGCSGLSGDVYFDDGERVHQITEDSLSNQSVFINDHDELIWARYDFCLSPWESSIMLYSGGVISQLPSADTSPQSPRINNLGQVAWDGSYENGDRFIELWQDGFTVVLTEWGQGPKLNHLGEVGFSRWDDVLDTGHTWVYRDGSFTQITDGSVITGCQDINDLTEMALYLNFGHPDSQHTDIGILRRVRSGEADFDGDVDADDYATLAACMTGPVDTDRLCECRFLDLDHDRDVDLGDFATFQNSFTGDDS